jgi:ATP synthase protein I
MRENPPTTQESPEAAFSRKIGAREARKLKAKRRGGQDIWFGLGMLGLIGWAVTIPTLLGILLGVYIDKRYPGVHSWTLSLLIVGLFVGCLNAWHWVAMEEKAIREDEEKTDE